ncbi:MAG TPA: glycosyltransferase family 9 protein [Gemmatimonadaceae bacterium]|nr:glycosyltransferase family 9 protein [Gemmatimonadaceae bacterium]
MTRAPDLAQLERAAPHDLRRVCIVLLSAVGDVVHTLPVVNALKRDDPTRHITWLLQPGPATLVRGHPSVDDIIVVERSRGWRGFLDARRTLHAREFDIALALQDYIKAGVLTTFTRAPVRLGFDRARARDLNWLFTNVHLPANPRRHVQDEYLEFLTALGISAEPIAWHLGPRDAEREWQREFVSRFDRPIASLVIGSSRPEKDWPADRWAELARILYNGYGLAPVIVGARTPREVAAERVILAGAPRTVSALDSGLPRLTAILDASALVISLDTGPLHMAVALGRPVVSLIGYTNPLRYGPYRRFQDLVVSAYGTTTDSGVFCTDRRPGRMGRIAVGEVLDAVDRWREVYASGR